MQRILSVFGLVSVLLTLSVSFAFGGTIHVPADMKEIAYGVMADEQPYNAAITGLESYVGIQSFDPLDNWHLVNPLVEGGKFMALATDAAALKPKGLVVGLIATSLGQVAARIVSTKNLDDWTTEVNVIGGKPNAVLFVPGLGSPDYGRFVAVGGAMIAYSDDVVGWTQVYSGGADQIYDVAIGKKPGTSGPEDVFVAVGTAGKIMTSPTAEYWTAMHVTDINQTLYGVAYGNNKFISVGGSCKIRLSTDSVNWITFPRDDKDIPPVGCKYTATTGLTTGPLLRSIAYGKGRFVVTTDKDVIYTTTDGIQWQRVFAALAHNINKVAFINNMFIAIGSYGTVLSSPDGLVWTVENFRDTDDMNFNGIGILSDNKTYVLVGDGVIASTESLRSSNWQTWSLQTAKVLNSVTNGNSSFVVAGDNLTIMKSADGGIWTNRVFGGTSSYSFKGITFGNGNFVAVGGSTTEDLILTSADGSTWTEIGIGTVPKILNGITFGNNKFIAVGDAGTVLTSPNAVNWTLNPVSDSTAALTGVAYGGSAVNKKYVAVAKAGKGFTSPDAITWTAKPVTTTSGVDIMAIAFGGPAANQKFVAVGGSTSGGKMYYSTDGETWTEVATYPLTTMPKLYGVFWDVKLSLFFAVGEKATVLSSSNGTAWITRVNDPEFFPQDIAKIGTGTATLRSIAYGNNIYVAVGDVSASYAKAGLILKSDPLVPPAPVNIRATATSTSVIKLVWDDKTNEKEFQLFRKKGAGAWTKIATLAADVMTYNDAGATGNSTTAHSYYLKACNARYCSASSKTVLVPFPPTGLAGTVAAGKVNLTWAESSNENGYEIYKKAGTSCATSAGWTLTGTVAANVHSFSDTVGTGKTFSYKVRSMTKTAVPNSYGYSGYSNCITKTTP